MQKEDLLFLVNEIQQYNCETQSVEVKAAHDGCPTKLYGTLSSMRI
jgi:ATP-dependent DNA helicase RecG